MKHKTEKKSEIRINETDIVELDVPRKKKEDFKDMDVMEFIRTYGIPFEAIEIDM